MLNIATRHGRILNDTTPSPTRPLRSVPKAKVSPAFGSSARRFAWQVVSVRMAPSTPPSSKTPSISPTNRSGTLRSKRSVPSRQARVNLSVQLTRASPVCGRPLAFDKTSRIPVLVARTVTTQCATPATTPFLRASSTGSIDSGRFSRTSSSCESAHDSSPRSPLQNDRHDDADALREAQELAQFESDELACELEALTEQVAHIEQMLEGDDPGSPPAISDADADAIQQDLSAVKHQMENLQRLLSQG